MSKRQIITIDEEKCTGCGNCIPGCPEGALQIIDDKARLVSDLFCDGLGACIGDCPEDAISVVEREAEPYDEAKVMENIVKKGKNVIRAHLEHLNNHGETEFLRQARDYLKEKGIEDPLKEEASEEQFCSCPGSSVMDMREDKVSEKDINISQKSELGQWPVQIHLVPTNAPYFNGADLLVAADCVPFAYGNFHRDFIKGRILLVGCPKLDDAGFYRDKITNILRENDIKSITIAYMEVPCCFGMVRLIEEAVKGSGKDIPVEKIMVNVKGEIVEDKKL